MTKKKNTKIIFDRLYVNLVLSKKKTLTGQITAQCGQERFRINPYLNSPCKLRVYNNTGTQKCQSHIEKGMVNKNGKRVLFRAGHGYIIFRLGCNRYGLSFVAS